MAEVPVYAAGGCRREPCENRATQSGAINAVAGDEFFQGP